MLIDKTIFTLFKQGSRTYFYSTLFFPMKIRQNVFILYAFVRKVDNFVDQIPQDKQGFYDFWEKYKRAWNGEISNDIVIDSFIYLAKEKKIEKEWIDAFFYSMEMDSKGRHYKTIDGTLDYIYGSAEVIGLFKAKILGLVDRSYDHARFLGRAMQYINFIRDIDEDNSLGRLYFPEDELEKHGLKSLEYDYVKSRPDAFKAFIQDQLDHYCGWQEWAETGYSFIPRRYLISIKSASEMYNWTAKKISENPFIIYRYKVKPMISQIIMNTMVNIIDVMVKKDQEIKCEHSDKKNIS